jgi:hypothetical protein
MVRGDISLGDSTPYSRAYGAATPRERDEAAGELVDVVRAYLK